MFRKIFVFTALRKRGKTLPGTLPVVDMMSDFVPQNVLGYEPAQVGRFPVADVPTADLLNFHSIQSLNDEAAINVRHFRIRQQFDAVICRIRKQVNYGLTAPEIASIGAIVFAGGRHKSHRI